MSVLSLSNRSKVPHGIGLAVAKRPPSGVGKEFSLTYVLILITTLSTIGAQLMLKQGLGPLSVMANTNKLGFLGQAVATPWVWAALVLQVFGYLVWFFVISQEKLGVAFAVSGAFFYMIMAFMAWLLFGEQLSTVQWAGLGLIATGVVALARG